MRKVYKLNLNKFGIFILTVATFALLEYVIIEILLGLAGML